jgi:hypothetical protein
MHYAALVRVGKRIGQVVQHSNRVVDREPRRAEQPRAERLALDIRHCEIQNAVCLTGRQHRDDVRVLKLGDYLDLATEPLDVHTGELRVKHLHDHPTIERTLASEEHPTHAAAAELALDGECVAEGCVQLLA